MTAHGESGQLKKTLKRRHLFTLGIGTIVGVAWLIVLGSVIAGAGPLGAVIGFVVGAVLMIPVGLCYGELSAALPHAGGEILYAFEIFGLRWAYVAGICLALIYVINCVFFAVSAGWLLNVLMPGVEGPKLYAVLGAEVHVGDLVIGTLASLALLAINWRGARESARLQDVATYTLLVATCVFIVVAVHRGDPANLTPLITPSDWGFGWGGVLGALAVTPYFFGGFNTIPQAVAELESDRDRGRVAGVLSGSILISLAFYVLVIIAVAIVLPRQRLLAAELPVADAFRAAFRSHALATTILATGLLGLVAVWNALFFAATRVFYVLGRARLLDPGLGRIDPTSGAPRRAIVFVTALSVAGLFLGRGVLIPVVNVTSTLFALMYAIVSIGTLRMRRYRTATTLRYRVPGGRWLVWVAAAFSVYLIGLSLVQQRMASPDRVPAEWLVMVVTGSMAWILWRRTRALRESISDKERRRILLDQGDTES